jgi:polysaccharide biosynthesis protein PslG
VFAVGPAKTSRPPEPATLGDRIGISTGTVWLAPAEGARYLRLARDGGIGWVREDFAWSAIEPQRGRFDWRRTDSLMRATAGLGMNVLALAAGSPAWASGHPESDKYPPRRAEDYAAFVRAVAQRYGVSGTFWRSHPRLARRPLNAIEIWNEPWHAYFWRPSPNPGAYARLVRLAATAIKAVHPEISVLASGDIFELAVDGDDNGDWLQPLLAADPDLWRSRLVDGWSVHTYCQRLTPWDTTAPERGRFDRVELTRSLSLAAGANLPIWITEVGWNTSPDRADSVSEDLQAQYVYAALVRAARDWAGFVRHTFIYTLDAPSREQDYNLLRPDGSPRPAWAAVKKLTALPA